MKLAIVGSRDFCDYPTMDLETKKFMKELPEKVTRIVSGGAEGADKLGKNFARKNRIKYEEYPADWDTHGKSAGMIRNRDIVNNSDAAIVFWDSKSRGTKNTISHILDKQIPYTIVMYNEDSGLNDWLDYEDE